MIKILFDNEKIMKIKIRIRIWKEEILLMKKKMSYRNKTQTYLNPS